MTQALRAVLFDVFGTLLDVHSVAQSAERVFPGAGMHLSLLWRDKQIEYSRVRALSQRYVLFSELTRDALRYAADVLALPLNDAICDALMNEYSHLSPFADARPALMRWQQQGAALGVLSNGDREMLVRALRGAAIDEFFPHVLSADAAETFKTAAAVYQLGPDRLRLPAAQILFVSSNGWDAAGAKWFGYRSFWVNRNAAPRERLGPAYDGSGRDLGAAADYFFAHSKE